MYAVYDYKNYFNTMYDVYIIHNVRIKALLFQMKNSMTVQVIRAKQQHILVVYL